MASTISIEDGWKILEDLTTNANQAQQQVLEDILTQNAHTEYLNKFLHGRSDMELFKKKVPVVSYDDIKPYMDRIANGESSDIILAEKVIALTRSSGTSAGQPKMIPLTAREIDRITYCRCLLSSVISKFMDGLEQGKGMHLLFIRPEINAPSGLPTRPILTSYQMSRNFEKHESSLYTSPIATILCKDSKQSMYCQFLCGLLQRSEVNSIGAIFASVLIWAIRFLEEYWKELCLNIRTGQLSDWISDSGCINALSIVLSKPDPEVADLVEEACNSKSWEGIIKKLWPGTKYIDVIVTGSMAQYVPMLEFYCGGLPLVSKAYASSECFFGINLKPLSKTCDISYTLLPNIAYFEFLRIKENIQERVEKVQSNGVSDQDFTKVGNKEEKIDLVDLMNVKPGRSYELVVTTFTCLYRYKVGDILMVTGYHYNAPQFRFVSRQGTALSIDMEKTSEEELLEGVIQGKLLLKQFGLLLTDYTSYADISSIPGHYVLFWELKIEGSTNLPEFSPTLIEQCCSIIEESLSFVYKLSRKGNSIGPLEIRLVKHGTFDRLTDFYISKGSSFSQYKTPRCINVEEALKLLDSRVVGRYFSQNAPAYKPLKWQKNKSL